MFGAILLVGNVACTAYSCYRAGQLFKKEKRDTSENIQLAVHAGSALLGGAGLAARGISACVISPLLAGAEATKVAALSGTMNTAQLLSNSESGLEFLGIAKVTFKLAGDLSGIMCYSKDQMQFVMKFTDMIEAAEKISKLQKLLLNCQAAREATTAVSGVVSAVEATIETHKSISERQKREAVEKRLPQIAEELSDPLEWVIAIPEKEFIPEEFMQGAVQVRAADNPVFSQYMWDAPGVANLLPVRYPVRMSLIEENTIQYYEYAYVLLFFRKLQSHEQPHIRSYAQAQIKNLWSFVDIEALNKIEAERVRVGLNRR